MLYLFNESFDYVLYKKQFGIRSNLKLDEDHPEVSVSANSAREEDMNTLLCLAAGAEQALERFQNNTIAMPLNLYQVGI